MPNLLKGAFVAACGGLFGAIVGLELKEYWAYSWALGMALGALAGWIGVAPQNFWSDVKYAGHQVFMKPTNAVAALPRMVWVGLGYLELSIFILAASAVLYGGIPLGYLVGNVTEVSLTIFIGILLMCSVAVSMITVMEISRYAGCKSEKDLSIYRSHIEHEYRWSKKMAWEFSPIKAPYWIGYGLLQILKHLWLFATIVLHETASDLRLCAAIGAASGALLGWSFSSLAVGFITGGLFFIVVWGGGKIMERFYPKTTATT